MRKHIYLLLACFFVWAGCSNDDIEIVSSANVTIKVSPETVVSGFPQFETGELLTLPSGYALRTDLLIYNEAGELVYNDNASLSGYGKTMTSEFRLDAGSYTAVAITRVYITSNNELFWDLSSDVSKLADLNIYSKYYNAYKYGILGLFKGTFTIDGSTDKAYSISVKPAGALFAIEYVNIQPSANYYALSLTRESTSLNVRSMKTEIYGADNSINLVDMMETANHTYGTNLQTYAFVLPVATSTKLKFSYSYNAENFYTESENEYTLENLKAGQMYYCLFYIDSDSASSLTSEVYLQETEYDASATRLDATPVALSSEQTDAPSGKAWSLSIADVPLQSLK